MKISPGSNFFCLFILFIYYFFYWVKTLTYTNTNTIKHVCMYVCVCVCVCVTAQKKKKTRWETLANKYRWKTEKQAKNGYKHKEIVTTYVQYFKSANCVQREKKNRKK